MKKLFRWLIIMIGAVLFLAGCSETLTNGTSSNTKRHKTIYKVAPQSAEEMNQQKTGKLVNQYIKGNEDEGESLYIKDKKKLTKAMKTEIQTFIKKSPDASGKEIYNFLVYLLGSGAYQSNSYEMSNFAPDFQHPDDVSITQEDVNKNETDDQTVEKQQEMMDQVEDEELSSTEIPAPLLKGVDPWKHVEEMKRFDKTNDKYMLISQREYDRLMDAYDFLVGEKLIDKETAEEVEKRILGAKDMRDTYAEQVRDKKFTEMNEEINRIDEAINQLKSQE
ncbi:hypothetical protein [Priestia koreensis]|uniref:hypothetical protein n=1 Tax=Priestia koreensis TaxID=284581 RepID=UPI00203F8F9F|nr:hypothetical protein [Priestia koreensis]MCM3006304.1 hypothetical protein [Priestia koreensis]